MAKGKGGKGCGGGAAMGGKTMPKMAPSAYKGKPTGAGKAGTIKIKPGSKT